jgi:hypothetical protein
MAYCGPRGIELDTFLRWSPRSQEAALDWADYEGRRCQRCGTHPQDWAEDRYAHHAHLNQCRGCQEQQRLSESPDAKEGRGVYVVIASGPATDCPACRPSDD